MSQFPGQLADGKYVDPRELQQKALQATLGGPRPGVSNAMPVDPRGQSDVDQHYANGVTAGQDMSWMLQPGAVTAASGRANAPQSAPNATAGSTSIPNNDPAALIRGLLGNGASSPQALAAIEPQLSQHGITLQKDSAGAIRGRLYLPSGEAVDVVNNNGWGQPWTFINRGQSSGESPRSQRAGMGGSMNYAMGSAMPGQSDLMAQILSSLSDQAQPDPQALLLQALR